jgi:D-glycero-D-manno-heptose 1,7-bisphosphate phosphatase
MPLIEPDGLWRDIRSTGLAENVPALFLDRDGTLIEMVEYLADPAGVRLIDTAVEAVRQANKSGLAVVIVTNQSGIGRGYYDWVDFEAVQARLYDLLEAAGVSVDATYACPHPPPEAGGPQSSTYRKPAPGMLLRAADDLGLNLANSLIAGDSVSDLAAGKAAGLAAGILVETGYGARDRVVARALATDGFDVDWAIWDRARK